MDVLAKWECNRSIRELALKCVALMAIVLQRTSPVEVKTNKIRRIFAYHLKRANILQRQIELVTICQLYIEAVESLLRTNHFITKSMSEKFEISHDDADDDAEDYIDPSALVTSVGIVRLLLSRPQCSRSICAALIEVHFIQTLCAIPKKIKV